MTGNNCGRAPVNHKAVNIMAQPRLATLRLMKKNPKKTLFIPFQLS
jgi:hypothetical protein